MTYQKYLNYEKSNVPLSTYYNHIDSNPFNREKSHCWNITDDIIVGKKQWNLALYAFGYDALRFLKNTIVRLSAKNLLTDEMTYFVLLKENLTKKKYNHHSESLNDIIKLRNDALSFFKVSNNKVVHCSDHSKAFESFVQNPELVKCGISTIDKTFKWKFEQTGRFLRTKLFFTKKRELRTIEKNIIILK